MERNIGRIWMGLLAVALAVVVLAQGDALTPIEIPEGGAPFRTALVQLGISCTSLPCSSNAPLKFSSRHGAKLKRRV